MDMPNLLIRWPPRFLRTPEAARFLGISPRTLEKHRSYGTGPKYRKIGGRVVYALSDLKAWADVGLKQSTSDPGVGTVSPAKPILAAGCSVRTRHVAKNENRDQTPRMVRGPNLQRDEIARVVQPAHNRERNDGPRTEHCVEADTMAGLEWLRECACRAVCGTAAE